MKRLSLLKLPRSQLKHQIKLFATSGVSMAPIPNPRVVYNKIPKTYPVPGETLVFESDAETIDLDGTPLDGGVLVKILDLSLDPYLRTRMRDPATPSYSPAFEVGKTPTGGGVVRVVRSEDESFKKGDHLVISFGLPWSAYAVFPASSPLIKGTKITNSRNLPLSAYMGVAGMPGKTAFYSLREFADFGRFKEEGQQETIFVSTAAGAVGSIVVQLAKLAGLRVIGSTGSDEKVSYLKKELGVDVAFNYKTTSVWDVLKEHGPVDIFYDNVGGEQLDAALQYARGKGSRFILCGQSTGYNSPEPTYIFKNIWQIVGKSIQINGFGHFNLVAKHGLQVFEDNFLPLVESGKVKFPEHKTKGLENLPEGFLGLLQGANTGKAFVVVAEE